MERAVGAFRTNTGRHTSRAPSACAQTTLRITKLAELHALGSKPPMRPKRITDATSSEREQPRIG